ncbi:MAG TPA: SH3 domain-containing protein [Deltaproteobacteria bacterium]|nr:SH3 domain-containing protein [Deltaproteobacteria bacterium]
MRLLDKKMCGYSEQVDMIPRIKSLLRIVLACTIMYLLSAQVLSAQDWGLFRCADSRVNIRAERSTESAVVCQLSPGDIVKVDFLEGSWWAVFRQYETERNPDKALGYVYAPLLRPVSKNTMKVWGSQAEKTGSQ